MPREAKGDPMRTALTASAFRMFPPKLGAKLLADRAFKARLGASVSVTLSLGPPGAVFDRSELFSAVRALLTGSLETQVSAKDGAVWRVQRLETESENVIFIQHDKLKLKLPGWLVLSPDRRERLAAFDHEAAASGPPDESLASWRGRLDAGPLADDEFDELQREITSSPHRVAQLVLSAVAERQPVGLPQIVPQSGPYFQRFIGKWNGEPQLADYVRTVAEQQVRKLLDWNSAMGLRLALHSASHSSISDVISQQETQSGPLARILEDLGRGGDRLSQVGAVEVALASLSKHPSLEPLIAPIVRHILADDPDNAGRLNLTSGLIVCVSGELARNRTLADAPPFWRRMAALAQASLVENQLLAGGNEADLSFASWAQEAGGKHFYLQGLIDLREEPRWLPDFVGAKQLKFEFLGRIANAARRSDASIQSPELRALLLDDGPNGVRATLKFPYPYFPGPLEGAIAREGSMPAEIDDTISRQLESEDVSAASFTAVVNSALLFPLTQGHADRAAEALQKARHRVRFVAQPLTLLSGLATAAAVSRSIKLAEEVKIQTRAALHRSALALDDALRVGVIAAAAHQQKEPWSAFVGEWMVELAFQDMNREQAVQLRSHFEVLCRLEPSLWRTAARGVNAIVARSY